MINILELGKRFGDSGVKELTLRLHYGEGQHPNFLYTLGYYIPTTVRTSVIIHYL